MMDTFSNSKWFLVLLCSLKIVDSAVMASRNNKNEDDYTPPVKIMFRVADIIRGSFDGSETSP